MHLRLLLCTFALLIATQLFGQDSLNLKLLYHWSDTGITGSTIYNNAYNEVWGVVANDREYAIIGSTLGTHFFDVTHEDSIREVDFIKGFISGTSIIHRDYHDYKGYLYMASDEGYNKFQIADLSTLPDSVTLVYESDSLFSRAHNIFIDSATAKLYVCAVKHDGDSFRLAAMEVYSLAKPLKPELLHTYNDVRHVHDVYVRNDTAYCNAGPDGLRILDFSAPDTIQLLASLTDYPQQGYNHSGWLNDGKNYFFTDETHGLQIKAYDITDYQNLELTDTFGSAVDFLSMAHNILIRDSLAFVSYYHDGLQIFDISDPSNVKKIAWYDTYLPPDHESYRGAWGVYPYLPSGKILVSDMQTGLYIFELADTLKAASVNKHHAIENARLYPNPFSSGIQLQLSLQNRQTLYFQLLDIDGKVIHAFQTEAFPGSNYLPLPFSNDLTNGMYYLHIFTEDFSVTKKLIKATH